MNKVVTMEDIVPLIKETVDKGGKAIFTPKGNSMLPMLRSGQDTVTLEKPIFPLKKYDLPLYVRKDGQYVLHRVMGTYQGKYVMRGDNQFYNEYGIEEKQIIGVVCAFQRKNKKYTTNKLSYKFYCRFWVGTARLRIRYKRARKFAGKIKRKLFG